MEETKRTEIQENKMGVLPVNQLLLSMAIPMMISMMVQALYNVVDSIFVSRISENALNAVSLAFPIQNLMIAVATGTGVGINALLSRSLGQKRFDRANATAVNGVFLGVCSYAVFAIFCAFFSRPFFAMQTDVAEIIDGGTQYLMICGMLSVGLFMEITFSRLLQATGQTLYSMIVQLIGAGINIVFDPIFIFVLDMGIAGAAVATILGQIVSSGFAVFFNLKYNKELTLRFKGFRPSAQIIGSIYSVGIPSIVMASIGSVMTFCMNQILIAFTTTATAVLGVYFKLQSFIFMPVFGLNNGMVPVVAYNFGARKTDRMLKTVKLSVLYASCIMCLGIAAFQLIPHVLLGFFEPSPQMLEIGVTALRVISLHFALAGFCIISSSMFQAMGHGMFGLVISLVRQLFVLLPSAWLLSLTGILELIWWAFPIAEVASLIMCLVFHRLVYRRDILPMSHPKTES